MSSPRALDPTRIATAFAVSLLVAVLLPFQATAAEQIRTDSGDLPGYTLEAEGSPLSMLLYEPVAPVPVDPGEPHGEGSLSYTSAELETGPVARAVASSFWPGAAVGDGFATLCDQVTNNPDAPKEWRQECNEEYALKTDARYPSSKQFPEEDKQQIDPLGAGMYASALGLDTYARASSGESPNEEALALGNARSRSDTTVEKSTAISTVTSSAEDVSIGGGVIQIKSVKTVLEATSDAKKGATTGVTEVQGLLVGGQGYTIDSKGLRPVQDGKEGDSAAPLPEMPGRQEMSKQLGIDIWLAKHKTEVVGADASREAGGLHISIRTSVLKNAITENVPVDDILGELPEQFDELKANLASLRALAPQIDYVFGAGEVRAAGAEGIEFNFDLGGPVAPPPPPAAAPSAETAPPPSLGSTSTGTSGTPGTPAVPAVAGTSASKGPAVPSAAPPAAAPAVVANQTAAQLPAMFGGLPPGLVAAGLVLAALGGRALAGFTGMAMSGVTGAICDRGVPRKVPNLRS